MPVSYTIISVIGGQHNANILDSITLIDTLQYNIKDILDTLESVIWFNML